MDNNLTLMLKRVYSEWYLTKIPMKKLFASLMVGVFLLSGCSLFKGNEKQNFIDATIEAMCLVSGAADPFSADLQEQAKDVFKKYGFDVENEEAIQAVSDKYMGDTEVQDAILAGIKECGSGLFIEQPATGEPAAETPASVSDAIEEGTLVVPE